MPCLSPQLVQAHPDKAPRSAYTQLFSWLHTPNKARHRERAGDNFIKIKRQLPPAWEKKEKEGPGLGQIKKQCCFCYHSGPLGGLSLGPRRPWFPVTLWLCKYLSWAGPLPKFPVSPSDRTIFLFHEFKILRSSLILKILERKQTHKKIIHTEGWLTTWSICQLSVIDKVGREIKEGGLIGEWISLSHTYGLFKTGQRVAYSLQGLIRTHAGVLAVAQRGQRHLWSTGT